MSRSRDSISSLPDEVLGKILSLLPTRLAASTSVLSKRWKNLLSLVHSLDLSDAIGDPRGFSLFVDKTLALLTNSSTIKRFSLNCQHRHDTTRVDTWIRTALERNSFSELHLNSACLHGIKTESFTSNTLVKLTLSNGFFLSGLPPLGGGVFFPNLKTLSLVSVGFEPCEVYEHLISGCPVLEELFISYASPSECIWTVVSQSIAVSSPSVKRLSVSYPRNPGGYWEPPAVEVFRTPSLVYFERSGYVAGHYHVEFTSLVEARLDVREDGVLAVDEDGTDDDSSNGGWGEDDYDEDGGFFGVEHNAEVDGDDDDYVGGGDDDDDDDSWPDVANLVAGISNVKTLHLSSYYLEVFDIYCKSMPVFHKLLTLSFESNKERGWQVVPLLLKNSPYLETLVIKGLVHQVTDKCGDACVCVAKKNKKKKMEEEDKEEVCCLSTCQVKVLNVSGYGGTRRERRQMRHFLGNLKCLETVKVGLVAEYHREDNNDNSHYQRITDALTKLPRASSNCQIHFF